MTEYGLYQVELQFVGSKPNREIDNQSEEEIYQIKELTDKYNMQMSSLVTIFSMARVSWMLSQVMHV